MPWEEALVPDASGFLVYSASKALAEKEIWKFTEEHPDMDITTILSPFIYGPPQPPRSQHPRLAPRSSTVFICSLIDGAEGRPFAGQGWIFPLYVNVANVAKAHVLALKAPLASTPKCIIVSSGECYFSDAIRHLAAVRFELEAALRICWLRQRI